MFQHLGRNGGRLLRNLAAKGGAHISRSDRLLPRLIPAPIPPCSRIPPTFFRNFGAFKQEEKSLDDFQHEEITGPTVDRDESATGIELRESIDAMLAYNIKLKRALVAVGVLQLVVGWWVAGTEMKDLHLWYTALSCGVSLQLAYVLHQTMKPLPFFQRVEARSRMRTVTLSMQTIKAVTNLLSRSNVVARYTAVALTGAFLYEVLPHFHQ